MYRSIALSLLILVLCIPRVSAQVLPEDISLSLIPTDPKPGDRVTATAESFSMDLGSASISWQYNNAALTSGVGRKTVSFIAPNAGTSAVLSVTASGGSGTVQTSTIVRGASIDVIWEAIDSYTPPFYKGKALASVGSTLRVTAIPSVAAPRTLSYVWEHNDSAMKNQSGTNRASVTVKTDVLGDVEHFATTATGGTFSGTSDVKIPLRNPDILVYQKSNGFIDYAHGATSDVYITTPGITLRAEPFNFSISQSMENSLSIGFTVNEQSFVGTSNIRELSITKPDSAGDSVFGVAISSLKERLQNAKRSFTLHF